MKKVTEWLCDWLETSLWGFNSLLSRSVGFRGRKQVFGSLIKLVELGRRQVLRRCGKEEGSREVILRLLL